MWPFLGQNTGMKNHLLLPAFIIIPLQPPNWQSVSYDDIPSNKLGQNKDHLEIIVDQSASPLVYKLDSQKMVEAVEFKAELKGKLSYRELSPGEEGADDFPLRIGLVVAGDKTLNRVQKWLASDWVLKLHDLGDEKTGIDHVLFLNVTAQKDAKFKQRTHPLSELFQERIVGKFNDGEVHVRYELDPPRPILGLWVSSDGDDTASKYKVNLKDLKLKLNDQGERDESKTSSF